MTPSRPAAVRSRAATPKGKPPAPARAARGTPMFSVGDHRVRLCEGLTRRQWLRVGGLGAAGLALPDLLRARQARPAGKAPAGRAKSCILCFLFGAPAHQDVWDLKPTAPAEYRGEFRPIASSV